MGLKAIGKYQFGNPNIPRWKPPSKRPSEVSNYNHIATPRYEEIGLRHFMVSEVNDLYRMRSERDETLVCFWMPTASLISKIATIAEKVHAEEGLPLILDVGTGNGFLPFLLARTNRVCAVGVDPNQQVLSRSQFTHPNLELVEGDAAWAAEKYAGYATMVIQSWPPRECNLTRHIREISANVIVNIFDRNYYNEKTYRFKSIKGYTGFGFWRGPSIMDLNLAFSEEYFSFMGNELLVHLRNGIQITSLIFPETRERYPWIVEAQEQFGQVFIDEISKAEKMRIVSGDGKS